MSPSPLLASPSLGGAEPADRPVRIWLQPWAESIAAELHADFGAVVDLELGYLRYPERTPRRTARAGDRPPVVGEELAAFFLPAPVVVASGQTVRSELVVANVGKEQLVIHSNGALTASVLDAATGEQVGGFAGAQTLPLVTFRLRPQSASVIPLLIGTAASRPDLGYAVPSGSWAMEATLTLAVDNSPPPAAPVRLRTPPFPLTVTERDASRS